MGPKCGASLGGWSKLGVTGSAHHSSDPQGQIESKAKSTSPKRGLSFLPRAWPVFLVLADHTDGSGPIVAMCSLRGDFAIMAVHP